MKVRFYQTPVGRSPVEEFINSLPGETQLEIADAISLRDTTSRVGDYSSENKGGFIMPWKEMTVEQLAKSLGANITEIREKQRLSDMIVRLRKAKKMSQATLGKKIGVTQSRIAQIESGVGTSKITFDVLFHILVALGYDYRVVTKKAA